MGNCCCRTESPCGSAEETSGLLNDDSKATVPTGDTAIGGACGPEGDDNIKKMLDEQSLKPKAALKAKQSAEVVEKEPNNTQENGALQKEVIQKATPSPRKSSKLKEKSATVTDEVIKDSPAEPLQCTFVPPQRDPASAEWDFLTARNAAPEEENPASAQDKFPDSSSLINDALCPENHTTGHITLDITQDNGEEAGSIVTTESSAVAEPSEESSPHNEVLSVPNPQPTAAAGQMPSISAVRQEDDKESASCALLEDPETRSSSVCEEAGPEDINSHAACESSPGSESDGRNHSDEEPEAASCVREPETSAPADASGSLNADQDAQADLECSKEVPSLENFEKDVEEDTLLKGQDENEDVFKVNEEEDGMKVEDAQTEAETEAREDAENQEVTGEETQLAESSSADVKAEDETLVPQKEDSAEDGLGTSEEDLYRGAEELSESQENEPESTLLKVEDRCSLAPAVDILSYSEREWKGNTAKSALIKKGYKEMSQRFVSVRRVRGDNYCALRATLFQVLSHSTQLPEWLQDEDVHMLPERLEAQEGLISQWRFPGDCLQGVGAGDAILQLKGYMELLRDKWQAAADCPSAVDRQQLCERVFQGGEEELGLMEALKLLMLGRAVELHGCMQGGGDVPLFCWLLFARDSSDCPRSFLCNHLRHVGLSAGLEQVEMFLLGYALHCTIHVYRLYKADTEEFVTYYPDDHKDDWPCVCLVTEDDRHYNVPVKETAEELDKPLNSS